MTRANHFFTFVRSADHVFVRHGQANEQECSLPLFLQLDGGEIDRKPYVPLPALSVSHRPMVCRLARDTLVTDGHAAAVSSMFFRDWKEGLRRRLGKADVSCFLCGVGYLLALLHRRR